MKAEVVLTCSKCGNRFIDDVDACTRCEQSHLKPVRFAHPAEVNDKYHNEYRYGTGRPYPSDVYVELEDGSVAKYYFTCHVQKK